MEIEFLNKNRSTIGTLTQWDINREIKIINAIGYDSIMVHFYNYLSERALVVPATVEENGTFCKVPNLLLQEAGVLKIAIFVTEGEEQRTEQIFDVVVTKKKKPEDYNYEENIDYTNWVELSAQAKEEIKKLQAMVEDLENKLANGDFKGEKGDTGPQGEIGPQGMQGERGEQGIEGKRGEQGERGIQGEQGPVGKSAYQIWLDEGNQGTEEDFIKSLVGPKGEKGLDGDVGPQGLKGDTGDVGPQGPVGLTGPQGPIGPQGVPGVKGDKGDTPVKGVDYWTIEDKNEVVNDTKVLIEDEIGNKVTLNIDENYVMTLNLLNPENTIISTSKIDLPIESMIINATYANGIITLSLQNGNTIDVNISDLVNGLVNQGTFNTTIEEINTRITSLENRPVRTEKLTFTGAVTAEYDGTQPVTINIPQGGGAIFWNEDKSMIEWEE